VALECGFGTVETMRRAFARRVSVNPSDYRARFRSA
jgi:AraC-like DNA-binding protein